ncbi:XRE family transcriptional regulator [Arthrobacter sp. NPDC089319]|uniref:helix-turn-helix domain-containing protein n=1 Tax=Arthrobacter sp. NPDC089319 TaxID=3155915 RepID=UPI003446EFA7
MLDHLPQANAGENDSTTGTAAFGRSLREVRTNRGISQSELARRLNLSSGMISQLEKGLSLPSVSTMLAIAGELEVSLDSLFGTRASEESSSSRRRPAPSMHLPGTAPTSAAPSEIYDLITSAGDSGNGNGIEASVQRLPDRPILKLEDGVTWELLTTDRSHSVLFVIVTYPPGAATTSGRAFVRHPDIEYFLLLEGELDVSLEFEHTTVRAGDSMWFDSMRPHLFENRSDVPARGVFFIIPQERHP